MEDVIIREELDNLLNEVEKVLMELEDVPDSAELINRLFRAIHSIKGSGVIFELTQMSDFADEMETLVDAARSGEMSVTDEIVELLFIARDHIILILEMQPGEEESIKAASERIIQMMQSHMI